LPARSHDASTRRSTIHRAPANTTQAETDSHEQGRSATSHQSPVTNYFSQLKEIFGDRLYIEVQHLSPGDGRVLREAERIGHELGVTLVAKKNVYLLLV
jgi:DNA polymerase III alpha subunit